MTQSELVFQELLGGLVPERTENADWEDVLHRAGVQCDVGRRWRPLVIALAVVALVGLAISPVGTAIADGVGGFASWVRGDPGIPASPAEQEEFQRANARTWASFAADTKLRRLLETQVSGTSFVLYGFRSGDDLCLRLVAHGSASATSTHCAPFHALQTAGAPAVVVATDEGIGSTDAIPTDEGFVPSAYSATFGIASDGVKTVVLKGDEGAHEALVGGNAFLYIDDHPKLGTRVRSAEAVAADGARVALGLQSAPFGYFDLPGPPSGIPQGPSRVERHVDGGSIGWIERLEPRGQPLSDDQLRSLRPLVEHGLGGARVLLARVLRPDPDDYVRVAVLAGSRGDTLSAPGGRVCVVEIDRESMGGGCNPVRALFPHGAFMVSTSNSGSSQYSQLSGLASDDVARLTLFLANGSSVAVPQRDNAFLVRAARSQFPIRLVAYDRDGRVIGIDTQLSDGMTSRAPREAQTSVRRLARVAGPHGETAVLSAGDPLGGYRCWTIEISHRGGGGGCTPWPSKERPLLLVNAEGAHGDVFLDGQLPPDVASLSVTHETGETVRVEPIDGFLLYAVPARFLKGDRLFVAVRAFDASGTQIDERGISIKRSH